MSKIFEDLSLAEKDKLYWAINEQVLSDMVDSVDKIDYSFSGLGFAPFAVLGEGVARKTLPRTAA